MFLTHPQAGKKLLSNIPRLEGIAEGVLFQEKHFEGGGPPSVIITGKDIPLAARILKVVLDHDVLLARGRTPEVAVEIMRTRNNLYDPDILAALDAEVSSAKEGFVIRALTVKEIMPGMILIDGVKDKAGVIIIPKGYEMTEVIKTKLLNFSSFGNVHEPIRVLDKLRGESL
jgi:hypothetical protein